MSCDCAFMDSFRVLSRVEISYHDLTSIAFLLEVSEVLLKHDSQIHQQMHILITSNLWPRRASRDDD